VLCDLFHRFHCRLSGRWPWARSRAHRIRQPAGVRPAAPRSDHPARPRSDQRPR
jgi:hypothetical protein